MPSFSSLIKRSKSNAQSKSAPARPEIPDNGVKVDNGAKEKLNRRQSRRGEFFRSLLNKSRSGDAHPGPDKADQTKQTNTQVRASPTSDTNKPLPPPPPPGASDPGKHTEAPIQLKKIITPPTLADIHKLFSGAPQFFVRSEGHHAGPPHPSVAFPWDVELEIRDLSDHGRIEDAAWGCVTTTPHIVRNQRTDTLEVVGEETEKKRPQFVPRCRERPNMLSMQGLERGTVGFEAALEIAVADALHEWKPDLDVKSAQTLRTNFLKDKKHGLRPLDESAVISKLVGMGSSYHDKSPAPKTSVEMYTELFTRVLFPPTRVMDTEDPTSLHVQIEMLVNVLTAPNIWVDFSNVEWRIRLGQILWGPPYQPGHEEEIVIDGEDMHKPESQQFWLLMQILLSCELLIRLDAVTRNAQKDPKLISVEEIHKFEKDVTRPVKWSLLLARLWLENIRINRPVLEEPEEHERPTSGWLASFKHAVTLHHEGSHHVNFGAVEFHSRHRNRQINGLVHFARKLRWPEADLIAEKFAVTSVKASESSANISVGQTPRGTPLSMTTQRSSYFAGVKRPGIRRGLSLARMSEIFDPSGWLSKSYLTGLILPGEGLSHFLMSTLLENDEIAIARLGEDANLYGGFVFSGQSFWSTACIIGRVLAAGKGASECMGWLSSPVKPKGIDEGWVNVDVELEPRSDGEEGHHSARIWKKHLVERDSYVLGDGDASTVLPGDFTLPRADVPDPVDLEVTLESLDLFAGLDSIHSTPSLRDTPETESPDPQEIRTYSAMMQFVVKVAGQETKEINLNLTYDVQFVTAHPCVPSHHTRLIQPEATPESGASGSQNEPAPPNSETLGPHTLFTGHPLHKSYNFSRHSLSSVVFASPTSPPPLLSLHTTSTEVFVIDCTEPSPPEAARMAAHPLHSARVSRKRRFGSDLEMLARAWCAEMGYNALVSRRGRNCIACSIREARALSWKIVLRFG